MIMAILSNKFKLFSAVLLASSSSKRRNNNNGLSVCRAGTPAPPRYYSHQLVDHFDDNNKQEWVQRYYVYDEHFEGPGSPIFMILGGEGNIEPQAGLLYPFVTDHLAQSFGAYVLEPEHRFYGESMPVSVDQVYTKVDFSSIFLGDTAKKASDPRLKLLTFEQALHDAVRLLRHTQKVLGCSNDRQSNKYCPVITVGGSYPGFLSAMARVIFPDVIDMAYAASAPMKFYSQQVSVGAYYEHITKVAEKSLPGCAKAVRKALLRLQSKFSKISNANDLNIAAQSLGICDGTLPNYIRDGKTFQEEVFMVVGYTFANDNMGNYPPNNQTRLHQSCKNFVSSEDGYLKNTLSHSTDKVKHFFSDHFMKETDRCFNMSTQLPTGPKATISAGDWSGVGTGTSGESWDFQTCSFLIEAIGFSEVSMFPPRNWTLQWLTDHCRKRFGVTPNPKHLDEDWHINDLVNGANASKILFTNGLNDGWSVGGILSNLSDSLVVLNFENGAHHSDLSGQGPSDKDTDDVKQGFQKIQEILSTWIAEIRFANIIDTSQLK